MEDTGNMEDMGNMEDTHNPAVLPTKVEVPKICTMSYAHERAIGMLRCVNRTLVRRAHKPLWFTSITPGKTPPPFLYRPYIVPC